MLHLARSLHLRQLQEARRHAPRRREEGHLRGDKVHLLRAKSHQLLARRAEALNAEGRRHHRELHRKELLVAPPLLPVLNEGLPLAVRHRRRRGARLLHGPKGSRQADNKEELNAVRHHLQRDPVRPNVVAAQSEANPESIDLRPRRLLVLVRANREVRDSVNNLDNLAVVELQPVRLPAEVRVKHEVDEREVRAPRLNLGDSPGQERQLRANAVKGSQSAERRRARRLHRQDHNKF